MKCWNGTCKYHHSQWRIIFLLRFQMMTIHTLGMFKSLGGSFGGLSPPRPFFCPPTMLYGSSSSSLGNGIFGLFLMSPFIPWPGCGTPFAWAIRSPDGLRAPFGCGDRTGGILALSMSMATRFIIIIQHGQSRSWFSCFTKETAVTHSISSLRRSGYARRSSRLTFDANFFMSKSCKKWKVYNVLRNIKFMIFQ